MRVTPKNHTISMFTAKLLTRLFILLLLFSMAPFLIDKQLSARAEHIYVYLENKWTFIFPGTLFLSFLTLLIMTLRKRYAQTDLNWMLSLNTIILIIYLILLYMRLYPLLF